jgi:hypothetical protein
MEISRMNGRPPASFRYRCRPFALFSRHLGSHVRNEIETAFFGMDGEQVLNKNGREKWTTKFDERDNEIETAFFGINGEPVALKSGYTRRTARFDERVNGIEKSCFDFTGKPTLNTEVGAARVTTKFDERRKKIETAYFGVWEEPVAASGWTREDVMCDRATGQMVQTIRHNAKGEVVENK